MSALAWAAAASGLANQPPGAVGVVALPVIVVAAALLTASFRRGRPLGAAAVLLVGASVLTVLPVRAAQAHDPGASTRWSRPGSARPATAAAKSGSRWSPRGPATR